MVTICRPTFIKRALFCTLLFGSFQHQSNAQLSPGSLSQLKVRSYQMVEDLSKGHGLGAAESFFGSLGQKINKESLSSISQGMKGVHISLGWLKEVQNYNDIEDKYLPTLFLFCFDRYLDEVEAFITKYGNPPVSTYFMAQQNDKLRLTPFKKRFHTKKAILGKTFHRNLGKRAVYLMRFLRSLKRQVDHSTDDKISLLNELFIICEALQELRIFVQHTKPLIVDMSAWGAKTSPKRIALTYLIFFEWHILSYICTKLEELLESIDQTKSLAVQLDNPRDDAKDEKHTEPDTAAAAATSPCPSLLGRSPSPDAAAYGARFLIAGADPTLLPILFSRSPSPAVTPIPSAGYAPVNRPGTPFDPPAVGYRPQIRATVESPASTSEPSSPSTSMYESCATLPPQTSVTASAATPHPSPALNPTAFVMNPPLQLIDTAGESDDDGNDWLFPAGNLPPNPEEDDPAWGVLNINSETKIVGIGAENYLVSKEAADAEAAAAKEAADNDYVQVTTEDATS